MADLHLQRIKMIMEPEPGNRFEADGVLNPAAARGPDGNLYIFPRLVAKGNYSRIGIARVIFDDKGDPKSVERLGIALEPETEYERRPGGGGGCEDPRISYMEELGHYTMTYTAFSPRGPRIALAISEDLFHWRRLGLATIEPYHDVTFDGIDDKDASMFPVATPDPSGKLAFAMIHRPLFPGTRPEEKIDDGLADLHRESIWISYRELNLGHDKYHLKHFTSHRRLAAPEFPWEKLKIGGGAPPILTKHGWLVLYHGVSQLRAHEHALRYSAGLMILDQDNPDKILYRSPHPVLSPELPQEKEGIIDDVVFPTGVDRRDDIGQPHRIDVYYGMADDRIGVARLDMPESLPTES